MNAIAPGAGSESTSLWARHISFVTQPAADARVLMEFAEPQQTFALIEPLALAETAPIRPRDSLGQLDFLFVPNTPRPGVDAQVQHEEWMAADPANAHTSVVEFTLKGDRILWRPGRALMVGATERMSDVLAGVVDFGFHEGELRKLESEIDADWPIAERDVSLTHGVSRDDVERWPHVNDMTHRTTLRRMRFARVGRRLEQGPVHLSELSRRVFSTLVQRADVADRLEAVDDRLEIFEDLYELANDRISEYSYFSREFRIEQWIVVLLVAEVLVMLLELYAICR